MSSDADYAAFLEKANQPIGADGSNATTQSREPAFNATNAEVPVALQKVEAYYSSDSDEPFKPISLKWSGKQMPREDEFQSLIQSKGSVSIRSEKEWDPKGKYVELVRTIQSAGGKQTTIYQAQLDKTRLEYYIVSLDYEHSRLVGLKALAVES